MSIARTQLGRADLLRLMAHEVAPAALALEHTDEVWWGYERRILQGPGEPLRAHAVAVATATASLTVGERDLKPLQMPYAWAVTHISQREPAPAIDTSSIQPLTLEDLEADEPEPLTQHQDLVPWARLNPKLREWLSHSRSAGLDVAALAATLARSRLPRHLPRLRRSRWDPDLTVLLDFGPRMVPMRNDMHQLARSLRRQCGNTGLDIRLITHGPAGGWTPWGLPPDAPSPESMAWRQPVPGATLLIVSELGLFAKGPDAYREWLRFIADGQAAGVHTLALLPLDAEALPPELCQQLPVYRWSPDSRLRRETGTVEPNPVSESLNTLLALMAAARRVDPPLLRAFRQILPDSQLKAGLELTAWAHDDVRDGHAANIKPEAIDRHLAQFGQLPAELQAEQRRLRMRDHAHLRRSMRISEDLRFASHAPDVADGAAARRAGVDFIHALLKQLDALRSDEAAQQWLNVARFLLDQADAATSQSLAGEMRALRTAVARQLGDADADDLALWHLSQHRSQLRITNAATGRVPVALLQMFGRAPLSEGVLVTREGSIRRHRLLSPQQDIARLEPEHGSLLVQLGVHEATVTPFSRPSWASGWSRDKERVWALIEAPWGADLRVPFPASGSGWPVHPKNNWSKPESPVHWDANADDFGPFLDLLFEAGGSQRFRFLPPGTFLMGSPARAGDDNERPQHPVTLTQGLWLADTLCTQALWQAVMGKNPSHFKGGPDLPVDSVSWNLIQNFLKRLNEQLPPGCRAELPTEAQWEYACRAGTRSEYWWGDEMDIRRANVDESGLKQTTAVKAYDPNPWGLHDMHGNLWEWCADARRPYSDQPQVDPAGGTEGDARALRGGAWYGVAAWARSAYRRGSPRGSGWRYDGFRFLLRSSQAQPGPGGQGVLPSGDQKARAVRPAEPGADHGAGRGAVRKSVSRTTKSKKQKR